MTSDSAKRVTQRYVTAELLTKQWLMGVRRGWLSLLKPKINDWPDIFAAFDRLIKFVDNLEEQVMYVRRGPYTLSPDMAEGKALRAAFKHMRDVLKDQRHSATFWHSQVTGTGGLPPYRKDDGEKMFEIYKNNFAGTLETHIKTKKDPAKGKWNPTRNAEITELLDKILVILRDDAKRLEKAIEVEEAQGGPSETRSEYEAAAFKEFSYGRMKVIVVDPNLHGRLIKQYIKWVDMAYELLRAKKMEKLWYGVMFIKSGASEKLTEEEKIVYEKLGYVGLESTAGLYHTGADVFQLTQPPAKYVAESIVHELGHRYWYKFMDGGQRERFKALVEVNNPKKPLAEKAEAIWKSIRDEFQAICALARSDMQRSDEHDEQRINTFAKAIKDFALNQKGFGPLIALQDPHGNPRLEQLKERYTGTAQSSEVKFRRYCIDTAEIHEFFEGYKAGNADLSFALDEWLVDAERLFQAMYDDAMRYINEVVYQTSSGGTVLPVSTYGKSHIREAFAEVFTWYVWNRDMARDQLESFRSVLASENASLVQQVVGRYLNAR